VWGSPPFAARWRSIGLSLANTTTPAVRAPSVKCSETLQPTQLLQSASIAHRQQSDRQLRIELVKPVTLSLVILALIAFAANSILCRLALGAELIDPVSFTSIRILAGAATLLLVSLRASGPSSNRSDASEKTSWTGAVMLYSYAIGFSLAYQHLTAASGALILFGCVQFTMMLSAVRSGETLDAKSWIGFALAVLGLVYLLAPGAEAPNLLGAALMALAGIAWGIYSLLGRGASQPIQMTQRNFLRASAPAILASLVALPMFEVETLGVVYAVLSGSVTSGLGYVLWYQCLPRITASQASIVQLAVPVIASLGGVLLLGEPVGLRLIVASCLILGGIAIAIWRRK
jgi:drug/metabolite transporter (DMT)-like permease